MIFEYTEWGIYSAKIISKIKIEDVNKILKEDYPTAEPVTEAQVKDIMEREPGYDNITVVNKHGGIEYLVDIIYDIISVLKFNDYNWELYETDVNDDTLENIVIKE